MDLLEENGDLGMVCCISISTKELEQADVIKDDHAKYYVLFNVETCNSGNWFNLQNTKDCCNIQLLRRVSVPNAGSRAWQDCSVLPELQDYCKGG